MNTDDLKERLDELDAGLEAMSRRVSARFEKLEADNKAIAAALQPAGVVESDQMLKKQLQTVDKQFKADETRAVETLSALTEMQKLAAKELAKLLGS